MSQDVENMRSNEIGAPLLATDKGKPHHMLNPVELAFEVGKEWLNGGQHTTSRLQMLIASALWFEREMCAIMADSNRGNPGRAIRQGRPGGMPQAKPQSRLILPPGFSG